MITPDCPGPHLRRPSHIRHPFVCRPKWTQHRQRPSFRGNRRELRAEPSLPFRPRHRGHSRVGERGRAGRHHLENLVAADHQFGRRSRRGDITPPAGSSPVQRRELRNIGWSYVGCSRHVGRGGSRGLIRDRSPYRSPEPDPSLQVQNVRSIIAI